ncbi:molybdenum cofactor biosynthesis protein B [Aquisalimonas asiatica]|uniref:Molybdenum cofactor biosynthesis protein B n=1 Tax=Aquisalimonas asiatica TaxID=406100 RepID=A0A1H8R2B0_9GAMM|nr:molybdenum cofactor biosynthesis protein B [Aquisalimonas asiatica]SEO60284.1 molybdenum cofactor biosynthesis protein B [Aquisalimonas asiatica]
MSDAVTPDASGFVSLPIAVLTVSDSRTVDDDKSGDLLAGRITAAGHTVADRALVRDDVYQVRAVVSRWIADEGVKVVISTGGTGITGRDTTPEAVTPLLDMEVSGFGELFRHLSWQEIGSSTIQSRAVGGVANGTLVFVLPGSSGACATAWDGILLAQLDRRHKPCNFVSLIPRLREHLHR